MRRDRSDKKSINYLWLGVGLVIYQISTSLYTYLTPLLGLFFCYVILLKDDEERTKEERPLEWYLAFSYIIFIELNKGFYLFSSIIFFMLFYTIMVDWMRTAFKCKNCILIAFITSGYLGIYGMNNLLAYVMNESFFVIGWEYALYIACDSIIAAIIFRDRML